ncbi:MAG: FAD-dependent monooxygenase [Elainella sp. C42_A2020_010]|nr:FAD-dependent monooxygenase [Elainella sp. C42_A2020_010]
MASVVIVGAGPAGTTLAYLLAQREIEVTLVEAAANFERVFRGEGLMPGGLYALEQMGLFDLLDQIPCRQLHAWEFVVDDRTVLHVNEPVDLGRYRPTIIPQPAFLSAVVERAQAFPSFRFLHGTVQALTQKADRVQGVVVRQADQEIELEGTLVIGADGRGSTVRRLANLPLQKLDYDADVLWLRLPVPLPDESQRSVFYGFICGSESLGAYTSWDDSLKFAYLVPRGQSLDSKPIDWPTRLAEIAPDWIADHIRTHAEALEAPIPLKVVFGRCPQWFQPGVLLIGDAAHPMAPIRAQGINLALRDVIVTANHLIPLLRTNATPEQLDQAMQRIQAERQPEIVRCQNLQSSEQQLATRLCQSSILRGLLTQLSPLVRPVIERRWLARQKHLRFGLKPVVLTME